MRPRSDSGPALAALLAPRPISPTAKRCHRRSLVTVVRVCVYVGLPAGPERTLLAGAIRCSRLMEHTSPGHSTQLPENAKAGKSSPRHAHEGSDACAEQQPSQRPVGAARGMGCKACRRLNPFRWVEQTKTNVAQRATKRCRCESTGAARGMSLAATRIGAKVWGRGSQRLDGESVPEQRRARVAPPPRAQARTCKRTRVQSLRTTQQLRLR